MNYTKLFDPDQRTTPGAYVYQPEITLAVNVALATGRPLLISGPSGCGKSTLAKDVAEVLGWEFESEVITSRTEASDLLYRVDYLQQLRDTHIGLAPREDYVTPGVLWRAFDPAGSRTKTSTVLAAAPAGTGAKSVVVLLDEIDKADPDVPNNLLEPFGDFRFNVGELPGVTVQALRTPLLIITTNNERRLPDAFIRRCVDLSITRPSAATLAVIGAQHFGSESSSLLEKVADAVVKIDSYSTAEYLDTVQAIRTLGIAAESDDLTQLIGLTVRKTAKQIPQ
jgi:MoxR-like ATPase